jgi:hypothetical protein
MFAMKARLLTLPLACFAMLTLSAATTRSQTVVTFDDLSETGSGAFFSSKYQGYMGLTWSNIACNNAILFTNISFNGGPTNGLTGNFYGMVSPSNVAVMIPGCEIDSFATNFNFLSAYLTGFWNSNLNIEVQGYRDANVIYDKTVVASATSPTLFTFDFSNINRLYFEAYGGQDAGFPPAYGLGGTAFIMDNFMFEFIPEPSSLLLTVLGAATLWAFLKRKRA